MESPSTAQSEHEPVGTIRDDPGGVHRTLTVIDGSHAVDALPAAWQDGLLDGVLYVDCEGVDLSRAGTLRVVTVNDGRQTYVFDVDRESPTTAPLKRVLESERAVKVMHACSMDSDALQHHLGIKLTNVIDIQALHGSGRAGLNDIVEDLRVTGLSENPPTIDFKADPNAYARGNVLTPRLVEYAAYDVLAIQACWEQGLSRHTTMQLAVDASLSNVATPRDTMPVLEHWKPPPGRRLGKLIGPKGANIRKIQSDTGTLVFLNSGIVFGPTEAAIRQAIHVMEKALA